MAKWYFVSFSAESFVGTSQGSSCSRPNGPLRQTSSMRQVRGFVIGNLISEVLVKIDPMMRRRAAQISRMLARMIPCEENGVDTGCCPKVCFIREVDGLGLLSSLPVQQWEIDQGHDFRVCFSVCFSAIYFRASNHHIVPPL